MTDRVVVVRQPTLVTVAAPGPQGPPGTPGSGGGDSSLAGQLVGDELVVSVTSNWGVSGSGQPYYDPAGAVAAEATIAYLGETGDVILGGIGEGGIDTVNGDPGPVVVLTKSSVGLGLVDNTADTAKPVSTTQQTALNAKAATVHTHTEADTTNLTSDLSALSTAVAGKSAVSHAHIETDVTGLVSDLAVKASQSYATSRAVALSIVLGG